MDESEDLELPRFETFEAAWEHWALCCIAAEASAKSVHFLREAFYSGALMMLLIGDRISKGDDLEGAMKTMDLVRDEITTWIQGAIQAHDEFIRKGK